MSASLEPQTTAKVRLYTTKGQIDIELWAKETPITTRRFIENIINGKFNDVHFNRILKGFIVQVDIDHSDDEAFKDEINSRIRFNKRGILGSVNDNQKKNSNNGGIFITLSESSQLDNKATAFGKVVGDTIFTVIKISDGQLQEDGETPLYPVKIIKCEVLIPYFEDLKDLLKEKEPKDEERAVKTTEKKGQKKQKPKVKLRLGIEDEDEEEEGADEVLHIKMKSAHDVLNDKKLSKQVVLEERIETEKENNSSKSSPSPTPEEDKPKEDEKNVVRKKEEGQAEEIQEEEAKAEEVLPTEQRDKPKKNKLSRELETLKLLKSFKSKISAKPTSSTPSTAPNPTVHGTKDSIFDEYDENFDNLDSEDSDTDIYTHSLKFEETSLENEDLLITIDDGDTRKKRSNEFYKTQQSGTIISKKMRR